MGKIRLTESQLTNIIKKVIKEEESDNSIFTDEELGEIVMKLKNRTELFIGGSEQTRAKNYLKKVIDTAIERYEKKN